MEMSGAYIIPAPRARVWRALNDPETLRQCIPGCESIDKLSDTEFTAKVRAKIGPVSAAFAGRVELSELDPPNSYRISGEGKGGVAGFAKGGAHVRLADTADGTELSYRADAQVGGKLAQIGSRLVDASAKSIANDFFQRFSDLVQMLPDETPAAPGVTEPTTVDAAATIAAGAETPAMLAAAHTAEIGAAHGASAHAATIPVPPDDAPAPPDGVEPAPQPDEAAAMDMLEAESRGLPPWVWILGVLVLLGVIVFLALQQQQP